MDLDGVTIRRREDMERTGNWLLVRRSLGLGAFGMNLVEIPADERTIAFPIYDGNGMFLSAGNVLVNAEVGLLFISFERGRRLRLNGIASIDPDDALTASWPG